MLEKLLAALFVLFVGLGLFGGGWAGHEVGMRLGAAWGILLLTCLFVAGVFLSGFPVVEHLILAVILFTLTVIWAKRSLWFLALPRAFCGMYWAVFVDKSS